MRSATGVAAPKRVIIYLFFFPFSFSWFFWTGSHYEALAVLELALYAKLASISEIRLSTEYWD